MASRGLIVNSIVPLRRDPDDRSEMESQLLFGETFRILDKHYQWRYIRNDYDDYEGWIDEKAFVRISDATHKRINKETPWYVTEPAEPLPLADGSLQYLPLGSRLPLYDEKNRLFLYGNRQLTVPFEPAKAEMKRDDLFALARKYLNAPYLWGGMTPFGIDCSGFTQMLFKITGLYKLPRNASDQAKHGERIDYDARRPGDLAFFVNDKGKIHHVGLVWFDGLIMHAHGKVRPDTLLPEGIYNAERDEITHTLVLITRLRVE